MSWVSWLQNEPVRLYLYGIVGAVLAVLVFYGVVATAAVPLFLALGAALLAVPTVESLRARVTPTGNVDGSAGDSQE